MSKKKDEGAKDQSHGQNPNPNYQETTHTADANPATNAPNPNPNNETFPAKEQK